jgi:hypothetical protein
VEPQVTQALQHAYGPVAWIPGQVAGILGEGWFLLKANPLPPTREEALLVAADIIHDRYGMVQNGQVRHNPNCAEDHSLPSEYGHIEKALRDLKPTSFKVAVHPGFSEAYFQQPLAIACHPTIGYERFPDHPHLNVGGPLANGLHLPDSFCYSSDIAKEFEDKLLRYQHAFARITTWLFRHMIWEQTRKSGNLGTWIGPASEETLKPVDFLQALNPDGPCRCRSGRTYRKCHFQKDLADHRNRGMAFLSNEGAERVLRELQSGADRWKHKQQGRNEVYTQLKQLETFAKVT